MINRYDKIVTKFASSLYCLIGKASYELLSKKLGAAILCSKTILREITSKKRVNEGEFQFDAVKKHLEEWNFPFHVHIQLDDTRLRLSMILKRTVSLDFAYQYTIEFQFVMHLYLILLKKSKVQ